MPVIQVNPTHHATIRMQQRRISQDDIETTVIYGRQFETRDAIVYVIGRREIRANTSVEDLSHLDGLHVIVGRRGQIITAYRDPSFRQKSFCQNRRH